MRQHSRYNRTNWSIGTGYCQDRTSVSIVGRIEPDPFSQPSRWSGTAYHEDRILVSKVSKTELAIFRIGNSNIQRKRTGYLQDRILVNPVDGMVQGTLMIGY